MASPAKSTNKFKFHRQRHGVCHRCGWSGSVTKVGRRDRSHLKSSQVYGRLCDECIDDLLRDQGPSRGAGEPATGESKATGDLDVA